MGYNLLINGIYWGYNPFTNHLLISWDLQVLVVDALGTYFWGYIPSPSSLDALHGSVTIVSLQHPWGRSLNWHPDWKVLVFVLGAAKALENQWKMTVF